jgi:nucleotide-binding universal stress UspA family protein
MFKRILVAVDGSHTSELALQEAIKLGKELQSQLRVVHVVDEVTLNWPEGGNFEVVMEAFRKAGCEVLAKAESELHKAGLTAETKLLELVALGHRVAEEIANDAATWPADLIIIGSHGRRGVSRLLLGSVAEGVSRVSHTPVLIIRGK